MTVIKMFPTVIMACLGLFSIDAFTGVPYRVHQSSKSASFIGESRCVERPGSRVLKRSRETLLFQADVPSQNELLSTEEKESMVDPIFEVASAASSMDVNGLINTAILAGVTIVLLSNFATVDHDLMRGWSPSEVAYRVSMDTWHRYSAVLEAAPIATKAVTSGTVYTIGDIIAQRTEGKELGELDRMRTLRSMLAGLIGHGPLSHVWYQQSETFFNEVLKLTAWWSFAPKIVIDQLFWGPIWNNTYIIMLGIMKGTHIKDIGDEVKRSTVPLLVSGLKLWPLAHCVTYGLIPVNNRLLWVDLVEILWVTILATQANNVSGNGAETADETQEEEETTFAAAQ